ncbi:MAG: hypothetical protein IPM92_15370 [Saprospiraceae bacterium]|nr:hypothetical protein [Saprospiraceae bacterium]
MSTNKSYSLFLIFLLLLLISCNKEKTCRSADPSAKKIINPNGDSELALLMREMYDETFELKQMINAGKTEAEFFDHEKILTAHATEPEKAASAEYKAFAQAYLQQVKQLNNSSPELKKEHFSNLISQCKNCHKALCPGPIVKINKLEF